MNRQLRFLFAFLLAAPIAVFSQGDPQTQTTGDPTIPQDTQQSRCPDGTNPISTADGGSSCASSNTQEYPGGQATNPRRSSLASGQAENADLTSQSRLRNRQEILNLPPEQLSEFQKFVANTTGKLLPIYGANLFRDVPSTFAPNDLAPATSDYVLGPDDELRVRIWGQINYSGNLRVDRSGNIYQPQVGEVHVSGIQFSSLDQHLRAAVSRDFRNFDLSVDLGRIRSIQIYVTGQARRPGAYTISSLSTLVNALFACGGPSAQGSLRHIEVRRNGQTITDFDLYGLLIHGDKSKDIRLLAEDVLYIAPAGPEVAVMGSVRTPGIYELLGAETIGDMIDAAGRTSTIASNSKLSLERLGAHQVRQALEFPFDASGLGAPMQDGDILRVLSIVPAYQKTVVLRGDVANQGRFSWKPGMRLSDLIPDRDSLLSPDYWWKRTHLGFSAPEFEPLISNFDTNQRRIAHNDPWNNPTTYSNELNAYRHDPASPLAQDALNAELAAQDRREETAAGNEEPGAMQTQQSNSNNQGGSANGTPNEDRQGAYPSAPNSGSSRVPKDSIGDPKQMSGSQLRNWTGIMPSLNALMHRR
jgi:protein involved in polysaccharide export with SLBB domain